MIKTLGLIAAYPFLFATGVAGKRLAPDDPKASLIYAHIAYWTFGIWHWSAEPAALIALALNWLLVQWLCKPKYQVAVLLAWAATDVFYLTTGLRSGLWDWILLALYVALSISEPDAEK